MVKFFKNGCWNTHPDLLEKCWLRILGAFERKYTLVGDARDDVELDPASSIVAQKDYQILDVLNTVSDEIVSEDDGQEVKLVRLLNNSSELEWTGEYSRNCPQWSPGQQRKFYSALPRGQFYMKFSDYLQHFWSTSINVDATHRANYQISSAGTCMKDKKEYFFAFTLDEQIDCNVETFGIICEQQGNRIFTANLPDYTKKKFYPSNFQIMLIYCGDEPGQYELVQSTFDSHFKLTLTVDKKVLPPGDYMILIAPLWNKSTHLDP